MTNAFHNYNAVAIQRSMYLYPSYLPRFSLCLLQHCCCFFLLQSKDFLYFYNQSNMITIFKVEQNNGNRILKRPHRDLPIKSFSCCLACLSFPINLFLNSCEKNPFTIYIHTFAFSRKDLYINVLSDKSLPNKWMCLHILVIRFLLDR